MVNELKEFYHNKKVLITGHTGFKGSWLCEILASLGAIIYGYSLDVHDESSLFYLLKIKEKINSELGDIRDFEHLEQYMGKVQPDIVIHLAAQPLVREAYKNPVLTYETNVMGTVLLFEAIRKTYSIKSVINVTTDKVYKNHEWEWGYRENDILNGYDPYSNSKSCSELVTESYKNSFFQEREIAISTCRAGNVIGGGDYAKDRIIPDCIRAITQGENIIVRSPNSTRPFQYVLEPLIAYLLVAMRQYERKNLGGNYNIGPKEESCIKTSELVNLFCEKWGDGAKWEINLTKGPHEANYLKLDCSKIKHLFGWEPKWNIDRAVQKTVEWQKSFINGEDMHRVSERQIEEYLEALSSGGNQYV